MSDYLPPTPDELRALKSLSGITGADLGALLDVQGRQVRRWIGGDATCPWAALHLWLTACFGRSASKERWRDDIADLLADPTDLYVVDFGPPYQDTGRTPPKWGAPENAEHYRALMARWGGSPRVRRLSDGAILPAGVSVDAE